MGKYTIRYTFLAVLLLVVSLAASGCGNANAEAAVALADPATMPGELALQSPRVTEAYRFAAANPEIVKQIPCYCGCGAMGHESNYNCFWQADGSLETHATGCGICVDIAQDTMQGLRQGRSLQEIRTQVDADYSRFGPSTDTPPVGVQTINWSNPPATQVDMTCDSTAVNGESKANNGNGNSTDGLACTSP